MGGGNDVVIDENRGREESRQGDKRSRGASRDTVASLAKRMEGVETSMTELKNQVEGLVGLDSEFRGMRDDFRVVINTLSGDLRREIHDLRDMFMGEITKLRKEVGEEISAIHQTIEGLQTDMVLCKRSMASGGGNTSNIASKLEVPKPSPFMGKREARAVDDFLWEMEQYMEGVNIVDDASKIKTATRYLKDTAALWWRRRYGDIERGTCTINTWADFVQDLKKQFYPENAKHEAKSRLRKLTHSGTIREYVKEFTTLVLEIPDLSEQDSLFYFLDGLQGWAKTELERRGVQDLATAIAHAEALIDLGERRSLKPTNEDSGDEQGGGEKQVRDWDDGARRSQRKEKIPYKSIKCFVCDGPHRARDCPKKMSLQAMMANTEESPCEEEDAHLGSLRILNAINARKELPTVEAKNKVRVMSSKIDAKRQRAPMVETKGKPRTKSKAKANGLRFVSTIVNGISTRALVDTGATHNFISVDEAKRLGLKTMEDSGWIKAANGDAKPIRGVARGVKAKIGEWEGELDLSVVPMDDYKLVLGMEFFDKVQAILITFTNTLCILDKGQVCMVTMERGTKSGAKMMSAMQLETGFKELKQNTSDISNDVETSRDPKHVLEEFRGVISRVLPERHALESCSKGRICARRRHRVTKPEQGSTMVEAKGESSTPIKARHVRDPTVLKERHDEDVASLGGGGCHNPPTRNDYFRG